VIKVFAIIAVVIVVAVATVLVLAATKPDTFEVQRAMSIKAPPEKIFALVNDLRGWGAWSPYERKDPAMKRSFSGAQFGKGAVYAWDGDKNVGQGRMEITETSAPTKIVIKLDFVRPFEGHNIAEFTMAPEGPSTTGSANTANAATNVTWAMRGPAPFVAKIMHVFFDMDRMIGKDFEEGLSNLKALAER
jgi:uncharacterized protein YndB with AHSA1/START domain